MTDQKKHFIIKAKSILCSGICSKKNCYLRVKDGIIQTISDDMPKFPGDEIIDLSTLMVSPCFCDFHLHFSGQAMAAPESVGALLLRYGISKAYEGGDKKSAGLSVKKTLNGRPGIITSGYALYKTGGYGSAIGRAVANLTDAVVAINELLSCHIDYLKIINSGVYEPESDMISAGGFEATELMRIVDYARERGLAVYCHANGDQAVREAVAANVTAIIHGLHVSDATLSAMADNDVAFIPTVHAFQSLLAVAKTDTARQNIAKTVDAHLSAVNKAFQQKVRVLPGSDSGPKFIPYGSAYIEELRLLLRAGIPFEDVIRSAGTGMLTEGAPADFVLLDNMTIEHVVFRGQFLL